MLGLEYSRNYILPIISLIQSEIVFIKSNFNYSDIKVTKLQSYNTHTITSNQDHNAVKNKKEDFDLMNQIWIPMMIEYMKVLNPATGGDK